jgi:hypothetical protein
MPYRHGQREGVLEKQVAKEGCRHRMEYSLIIHLLQGIIECEVEDVVAMLLTTLDVVNGHCQSMHGCGQSIQQALGVGGNANTAGVVVKGDGVVIVANSLEHWTDHGRVDLSVVGMHGIQVTDHVEERVSQAK